MNYNVEKFISEQNSTVNRFDDQLLWSQWKYIRSIICILESDADFFVSVVFSLLFIQIYTSCIEFLFSFSIFMYQLSV